MTSSGLKPGSERASSSRSTWDGDDVDLLAAVDDRRAHRVAERAVEETELRDGQAQGDLGEARVEERAQHERLRPRQDVGHSLDPRARDGRDVHRKPPRVEASRGSGRAFPIALPRTPTRRGRRARARFRAASRSASPPPGSDRSSGRRTARRAAELSERVPHALEQVGVLLAQEAGAEVAAVLLVAEDREDDVAARLQLAARCAQERVHDHRDAALHVERAAAPQPAVDELAAERRARPLLAGGGDDVDVPVQEERRRFPDPAHARDEVRPRVVPREDPRLDARLLERRWTCATHAALVPRRVRRVEAAAAPASSSTTSIRSPPAP